MVKERKTVKGGEEGGRQTMEDIPLVAPRLLQERRSKSEQLVKETSKPSRGDQDGLLAAVLLARRRFSRPRSQ